MPALFIAGTDTNVGKTIVTAGLAVALARKQQNVGVYKPVQTGSVSNFDLDAVDELAGVYSKRIERRSSYCFPVPATPWVSDTLANDGTETIDIDILLSTAKDMAASKDWLLLEGAGGLRVPITSQFDMLDLMSALGFPVLLVTRPNLGTINHTRLSLDALAQSGLNVLGVIVSGMPDEAALAAHPDQMAIESLPDVFKAYLPIQNIAMLPLIPVDQPLSESVLDCFDTLLESITKSMLARQF